MTSRPSPSVLFQPLEDGGVLFCAQTEVYYHLNPQGARFWHLMVDSGGDLEAMVGGLSGVFPEVPVEALREDAREFLAELASAGLLEA